MLYTRRSVSAAIPDRALMLVAELEVSHSAVEVRVK